MNGRIHIANAVDAILNATDGMSEDEKRAALDGLSAILKALAASAARLSVASKNLELLEEDSDPGLLAATDEESPNDRLLREQMLGYYIRDSIHIDDLTTSLADSSSNDAFHNMFESIIDPSGTTLDVGDMETFFTHSDMD